jgi:hypothetical protein
MKEIIRLPEFEVNEIKERKKKFEINKIVNGFGNYNINIKENYDNVKKEWIKEIRKYE